MVKVKNSTVEVGVCRIYFFRKIPPFLSLSLPLKFFSSKEFAELYLLLGKTHCIRVKSEKFLV